MWVLHPTGTWSEWAFLVIAALLLYVLIRASTGPLRESEARYRTLVEQAGSIILTMDPEGKITFFNRYAEQISDSPAARSWVRVSSGPSSRRARVPGGTWTR